MSAEYECFPGNGHSLSVKGGDAVFSVGNDGIIQVVSTDSRTLEFNALAPGETTVTATCGDETITARIIVIDPATTTTTAIQTTMAYDWLGTGTYTTAAVTNDASQAETANETGCTTTRAAETTTVTEATVTTAPTGKLPQTGNNDVTGLLVIIGAFTLTGITILKRAGILDCTEQSE